MRDALRSFLSGWGARYLLQRASGRFRVPNSGCDGGPVHVILVVANHFEPVSNGWSHRRATTMLERWCGDIEALGARDADGHPFKHTYFFPAEQYHRDFLDPLAAHCAAGFGEIEVHLHHGVDRPDTPAKLEGTLREFVARLADHGCLAKDACTGRLGYCFVHGNWALANSAGGRFCGVDCELEVLARTGCYLDCTLPSAPDRSQVSVINTIYQCARPLRERAAHRAGIPVTVGDRDLRLPILLPGPLLLDWGRRIGGLRAPRLENGDLGAEFPPTLDRFRRWTGARIHVRGRPDWVFVKLHTHGLVERHHQVLAGEPMRGFLAALGDAAAAWGYRLHFATSREAANMIFAAVDGLWGDPGRYRDYRYVPLRTGHRTGKRAAAEADGAGAGR